MSTAAGAFLFAISNLSNENGPAQRQGRSSPRGSYVTSVSSVPHTLEPPRRNPRVTARVLGIAVAEPILNQPEVLPAVGESVTAGVAQHVRVDAAQTRALAGRGDHVIDRPAHHLAATLGDEQPGQLVFTGGEVARQGPEFVAGERLLAIERALHPLDPEAGLLQVHVVELEADGFRDAQAVPVGQQKQGVISRSVPAPLAASSRRSISVGSR